MHNQEHIALLGDSTIDNVCWTGHPKEVPAQLRDLLQSSDVRVSNLAADGFTSSDLLHGAVPHISWAKRQEVGDAFPETGDDRVFWPLHALESLDPPATYAVISIGGNDVREILGSLDRLEVVLKDFQHNYSSILDHLCKTVPKVVLMFQYRPSFHMDAGGYGVYQAIGSLPGPGDAVAKLNHLMEAVYTPILVEASKRRLPVVDLPRTFDINNDSLYCAQIEPSAEGGKLIAELISHVVRNHDFSGSSTLYFKPSGVICEEINNGEACWSIPHELNLQSEANS
jgi:lysophospholipase L1-like esterase